MTRASPWRVMMVGIALAVAPLSTARAADARHGEVSSLAITTLHHFARCIVEHDQAGATALLAMDFRSPAYQKALRLLAYHHNNCLYRNGQLKFGGILMAGAMAERLLEKSARGADLPSRVALDPSKPPIQVGDPMELTSICIVRDKPAEVAALLSTEPASSSEQAATQALGPTIMGCVKAGKKMHLNTPALRALLALEAYRLVQANGAAA